MPRFLFALALVFCVVSLPLRSQDQKTTAPKDYLFAWSGDADLKGNDFLAVIDADPSSASYGHLVTTLATEQQTMRVHHTEYTMPASGMLFANDHGAGRTFIFDVRDPQHRKIVTSFTDMAGYMHPHSYLRLPDGNVLATFQHAHHGESEGQTGATGGLVEIDDQGKVIRSASTSDPAFGDALLMPYSLVVLPGNSGTRARRAEGLVGPATPRPLRDVAPAPLCDVRWPRGNCEGRLARIRQTAR